MMKQYLIVLATCLLGFQSFAQQHGSVLDSVNGRVYKTVKIGEQVWLAENLDVTTFRNGDPILEIKKDEEWESAGQKGIPAWCYYDNDSTNGPKYGKLYNWHAVNDPRGLAPDGWHIPMVKDWRILNNFLGENIGEKLTNKKEWTISNTYQHNCLGTNSVGFSALPAGNRYNWGAFKSIGSTTWWWCINESQTEKWAWNIGLSCESKNLGIDDDFKGFGFSIRCIKEQAKTQPDNKAKNENNFIFLEEDKLEPLLQEDKQIIEVKIDENKVYDEVDVDRKAEYFFGFLKWNEFISANIDPKNINKKCIKAGTYKAIIGFIVNTKGQIQYISPLSTNGCGIEEEAIRVINKAIKWEPAMKNGNYVTSYTKKIIEIKIEK